MPKQARDSRYIRRLFLSGLGMVYLIAFLSLWVQIEGLIGSRGILPAQELLDASASQLGVQRWWRMPTLAWIIGAGDAVLHLLCAAGTAAAVLLIAGRVPALSAFALWLLYLSLYTLGQDFLSFQWDILLLEAGFLAIFYAPPFAWRLAHAEGPPSAAITFLLRLLVAKLMFLSGAVKLAGGDPTWRELTALTWHYETTCLPTWTGWYVHQLPSWFHKLSALMMFAVELVLPLFAFVPRSLRLAAAAGFAALMLFIGATGNYGFFNLLALVLCLPLLDDDCLPRRWRAGTGARRLPDPGVSMRRRSVWPRPVIAVVTLLILALTPVPVARALRLPMDWPGPLAWLYTHQGPFHVVNGYGLFARMTTQRPEIIIEGSDDGQTWHAYEFRWKPGAPERRPGFVQPHMPRLDWQMWFAALGSPRNQRWFAPLCRRLLEGSPPVIALLGDNPFPRRPPRYVRAMLYDYRFSTSEQRQQTGPWWQRREIGTYVGPLSLAR